MTAYIAIKTKKLIGATKGKKGKKEGKSEKEATNSTRASNGGISSSSSSSNHAETLTSQPGHPNFLMVPGWHLRRQKQLYSKYNKSVDSLSRPNLSTSTFSLEIPENFQKAASNEYLSSRSDFNCKVNKREGETADEDEFSIDPTVLERLRLKAKYCLEKTFSTPSGSESRSANGDNNNRKVITSINVEGRSFPSDQIRPLPKIPASKQFQETTYTRKFSKSPLFRRPQATPVLRQRFNARTEDNNEGDHVCQVLESESYSQPIRLLESINYMYERTSFVSEPEDKPQILDIPVPTADFLNKNKTPYDLMSRTENDLKTETAAKPAYTDPIKVLYNQMISNLSKEERNSTNDQAFEDDDDHLYEEINLSSRSWFQMLKDKFDKYVGGTGGDPECISVSSPTKSDFVFLSGSAIDDEQNVEFGKMRNAIGKAIRKSLAMGNNLEKIHEEISPSLFLKGENEVSDKPDYENLPFIIANQQNGSETSSENGKIELN
ncbi:hypothetical protein HELRODRAFT_183651 [Helobdella robusta]|uniref:Uncharacterized protein n=1 Tax=Helobdella robusta TaxID=6412 RepID=T1FJZ9_HELRO|nr:hypothetical protein HELRODRAFT_183651 [Helobdella robusta]ESO10429.1 hypothetical protein HELRODRAFT_183651 [Helobdella robusta]